MTDDDIAFLRNEIANNHIQIPVSFETVQETTYAQRETALRGLRLIRDLCRRENAGRLRYSDAWPARDPRAPGRSDSARGG